jgi:tRNA(fMet)-specific endonuclease VapC
MALRYLLDTNILSDLIRRPQGPVAERIAAVGESTVCTSVIVAAELRLGAAKSGSQKLSERVDLVLSALEVLPMDLPADRTCAEIRWHLTREGTPIGPNDLLIAAQALSLGLTIVTANVGELSRVPGLQVENWLEG